MRSILILIVTLLGGTAFGGSEQDVPTFTCQYNYTSEGQNIEAVLFAKFHFEPYGLRTLEMAEAKTKEQIISFKILQLRSEASRLIIEARANFDGVAIPSTLEIPLAGGQGRFNLAGEESTVKCSAVK